MKLIISLLLKEYSITIYEKSLGLWITSYAFVLARIRLAAPKRRSYISRLNAPIVSRQNKSFASYRIWTSGSIAMPNFFLIVRFTSSIRNLTSAAFAPPVFTMKFGCLVEIIAPP